MESGSKMFRFSAKKLQRICNKARDFSFFDAGEGWQKSSVSPMEIAKLFKMIRVEDRFEPILDFDLKVFSKWIKAIRPEFVYIGYDNHDCKLLEPSLDKTTKLIDELEQSGIEVRLKTLRKAWFEEK